ncbi:MAG: hypothetical protein KJ072_08445 [Verrucomicrobia bacterium]|nr:hypothetical protein [Verrucomicrobiota bacterium]
MFTSNLDIALDAEPHRPWSKRELGLFLALLVQGYRTDAIAGLLDRDAADIAETARRFSVKLPAAPRPDAPETQSSPSAPGAAH